MYFDPDKELQCRCVVTRIEQKGRNIIALYKRIIDNKVEDEEFDINGVHVAEIEKMLGVYLSEDAIEELNVFIEARTKSTKGGASTTDSTLKLMKYTTDCVDTKDSIKMMNSMNKHDSTMDSTYLSSESKLIGTKDSTRVMSSTTDGASTMDSTVSTMDGTISFRSNEVRICRDISVKKGDIHAQHDDTNNINSRSCRDACNEGKGVNSSLPINSDIVEDHTTLFLKVLDLNRKDIDYKDVTDHVMMDDPKTFK